MTGPSAVGAVLDCHGPGSNSLGPYRLHKTLAMFKEGSSRAAGVGFMQPVNSCSRTPPLPTRNDAQGGTTKCKGQIKLIRDLVKVV